MTNNKIYYTGSTSFCQLTDHSCRKIGVPIGSSFSLLDPYFVVYSPCKTGGRDNTGVRVNSYQSEASEMSIIKPTSDVRSFLMRRAKGKTENKDNRFFISAETGELVSSGYLQGNGDWFPSLPKGTYEVAVSYEPFLSYAQLDEYVELAIQAFEAGY